MKLKGEIHIGRVTSNVEDDFITVELKDSNSSTTFARAKISFSNFSKAITSQIVDCEIDVLGLDKIGKKLETKRIDVYFPKNYSSKTDPDDKIIENVLSEFEIDGWKGDKSYVKNHHNYIGEKSTELSDCYSMLFRRYIEKEKEYIK